MDSLIAAAMRALAFDASQWGSSAISYERKYRNRKIYQIDPGIGAILRTIESNLGVSSLRDFAAPLVREGGQLSFQKQPCSRAPDVVGV